MSGSRSLEQEGTVQVDVHSFKNYINEAYGLVEEAVLEFKNSSFESKIEQLNNIVKSIYAKALDTLKNRKLAIEPHEEKEYLEALEDAGFICDAMKSATEGNEEDIFHRIKNSLQDTIYYLLGIEQSCSLRRIISKKEAIYTTLLAKNGNKLRITVDSSLESAVVKRSNLVAGILQNTLPNAARFTENGSVEVNIVKDDAKKVITITIADTGKGIPPHILPRIQAGERGVSIDGHGEGLAGIRKQVLALGGSVTVDSTQDAILHGTVITYALPYSEIFMPVSSSSMELPVSLRKQLFPEVPSPSPTRKLSISVPTTTTPTTTSRVLPGESPPTPVRNNISPIPSPGTTPPAQKNRTLLPGGSLLFSSSSSHMVSKAAATPSAPSTPIAISRSASRILEVPREVKNDENKLIIFMIDDGMTNLTMLNGILNRMLNSLVLRFSFTTGEAALENYKLNSGEVVGILIDQNLSELPGSRTGLDFAKDFRSMAENLPLIPIYLCSGDRLEDIPGGVSAMEGENPIINGIISKPVSGQALQDFVKQVNERAEILEKKIASEAVAVSSPKP